MGRRVKLGTCEFCGRGPLSLTFHHLVPVTLHANAWFRRRFTRAQLAEGLNLCRLCHNGIHDLIAEKDLGRNYNTREKLLAHEAVRVHVQWVSRQK